uniref:Putative succinate dehydrogenase cytochrome b subunit n=1 Tax=Ixodes ricinus TaxID=34613 RepID=A0A090XE11_IXORI
MSISPVLLVPFKFALAWALCYHTLNGMRHLAWDLGIGFQLKELYASGYTVLAISLVRGGHSGLQVKICHVQSHSTVLLHFGQEGESVGAQALLGLRK